MSRLFPSLVILLIACQDQDKQDSTTQGSVEISNVEIQSEGVIQSQSTLICVVDATDAQEEVHESAQPSPPSAAT